MHTITYTLFHLNIALTGQLSWNKPVVFHVFKHYFSLYGRDDMWYYHFSSFDKMVYIYFFLLCQTSKMLLSIWPNLSLHHVLFVVMFFLFLTLLKIWQHWCLVLATHDKCLKFEISPLLQDIMHHQHFLKQTSLWTSLTLFWSLFSSEPLTWARQRSYTCTEARRKSSCFGWCLKFWVSVV